MSNLSAEQTLKLIIMPIPLVLVWLIHGTQQIN